MAWAYVWATAFAGRRWGRLFVPAGLGLAVVSDIDLLLAGFGVVHHTFTHSFFFWLVVFAPFLVVFRLKSVPYFVAVAQHFAFGDLLVGKVMILWPFSQSYYGLNISMPSVAGVALETVGLSLALGIGYFKGDLRRLLSVDVRNIPMVLPFLALLTSMLFFAVDWPFVLLVEYVWSSPLLTTVVLEHIVLALFLAFSTTQGLRSLIIESSDNMLERFREN